ncbi:hypothetical protein [Sphaerisporangium sp. TRM90804]|uniref:hypothetical protein n=1 Tax=Sphaerisporangium sp. TRM90804 TaxID=3031113 RepID=UPI0024484CCE|nr:hypothetical protein [Sphaerisporangium sp. TRM90804]MDH2427970.1 hypothetical protein [Sphaerisporangium sp. TRM90804]
MVFLSVPPAAAAPVLPTPKDFVSYLDLECFRTNPYQPPTTTLTLRHLNPVLSNLPPQTVVLGPRQQLCVPVAKNTSIPPSPALDFIRFVDLACYRITGSNADTGLLLTHLNPVLQNVPRHEVKMNVPQQLCVPVVKNSSVPPPEIMSLVSHIDIMCYAITPNNPMNRQLSLRQLNPVLTNVIPTRTGQVTYARQLCVPVQKAGDTIPTEVLNILRWIDLEKFDLSIPTAPSVTLTLRHINPVLGHLPAEQATLFSPSQLAVPVAKNNQFPPS